MASRTKRRAARAYRLLDQSRSHFQATRNLCVILSEENDKLKRQVKAHSMMMGFEIDFKPESHDQIGVTVWVDRRALSMSKRSPSEIVHHMVEIEVEKAKRKGMFDAN